MDVLPAISTDTALLVTLINSAYRGEVSRAGWTTEADLIQGALRIDIPALKELLTRNEAVMLKHISGPAITGCVYLEKQGQGLYLGMLSVSPKLQSAGIGKRLLAAAEVHAVENECRFIFMQVISLRQELIAWYERRGYYQTGERKPFPADNRFGIPVKPLEFVILRKDLAVKG